MCGINQIYVPDEYLDEALKCQLLEFKFDNIFIFKYPLSVGYAIKDDLFGIDLFNNKSDVVTDNNRFCSAVTGIDNYCKSVDYHILYDDNNYYICNFYYVISIFCFFYHFLY